MAVTTTEGNLVQPNGKLDNDTFPKGNLADMLSGWLEAATIKVEANGAIGADNQNDAATAWVYHLAFEYLANQYAALPSSVSEGDGAIVVSVSRETAKSFREQSLLMLEQYGALTVAASGISASLFFSVAHGRRGR